MLKVLSWLIGFAAVFPIWVVGLQALAVQHPIWANACLLVGVFVFMKILTRED
jgi:hypothetical protein